MHALRWATWLVVLLAGTATADDAVKEEVIVVEDRKVEPDQVHLPAAQLREVPGALGDPVRTITMLPGFVPTDSNRPDFYVRGAPPGNSAMYVDGVRVPLLFHGGVATSVIQAGMVEAVDVSPSAGPARVGGVAGGVIELETVAPARAPHAEARVTIYEGAGLVDSPFADGDGSVLAAARLGYPGTLLGLLGLAIHFDYWDYQARTTWRLGEHDRVQLFGFGSHDHLAEDEPGMDPGEPDRVVDQLKSDFHRIDLRYEHAAPGELLRVAVTGGWTRQGANATSARDLSIAAHVDGELRVAETLRLRAGLRFEHDAYALTLATGAEDPAASSVADALPAPRNTVAGGYVDAVWDATARLRVIPGVRFDAYHSERAGATGTVPAAEPRFAARWRVRDDLAVTAATAIASQLPLLRVGDAPASSIFVPGFWTDERRLQRAYQGSAGIEWVMPGAMVVTASGFGTLTYGLTDLPRQCFERRMPGQAPMTVCPDTRSTGHAYGLELALRRPLTERLAGWLSYTYSHATETDATGTVPSPFDRTHVASGAIAYQLSTHWRTAARVSAYSGAPANVPDRAPFRLPWFERVDLRAERRWNLAGGGSLALVFDVLNATFSRDYDGVRCTEDACTVEQGSPFIVPSIGLEGAL